MCRMLIDNVKIILKLYQPVSVKQLSDQLVAASGFRCKKPFLKKFQLFGLFSGDGGFWLGIRNFWNSIRAFRLFAVILLILRIRCRCVFADVFFF